MNERILCFVGNWPKDGIPNLDEIPDTLHPRDFKEYVSKLTRSIWTNNPLVVDCFDADAVIVVNKDGLIKPLSTHKDYPKWKEEYNPGEFWSLMGEDWIK